MSVSSQHHVLYLITRLPVVKEIIITRPQRCFRARTRTRTAATTQAGTRHHNYVQRGSSWEAARTHDTQHLGCTAASGAPPGTNRPCGWMETVWEDLHKAGELTFTLTSTWSVWIIRNFITNSHLNVAGKELRTLNIWQFVPRVCIG